MDVYLKKLELHGFKSFPEKTVLQFHKGVTTVIGPNGCGKSNLVDAILWVLGEQRIKNLRGESNEDLIFSGSASKKPLGMTEVSAYFVHRDNETYVARRFFRSGESKYILNDKFCRNKDIQDFLFELGIGERNYFIFEQGSVEKIVTMKPTERRVLIEEAAGIFQYLERKKETANKLIIAQQNLDNLEMILLEKGKRLRELNNQVHFAQRYRNVKSQKSDLLKALLKIRFLKYREEFDDVGQKIEQLLNREAGLAKEINDGEGRLLGLEQQRWNLDLDLKKGQQSLYEVHNLILAGNKEIEKSQQRLEFLRQRVRETEKVSQAGRTEAQTFTEKINQLQEEVQALERERDKQAERRQEVEAAANRLKGSLNGLAARDSQLRQNVFASEVEFSRNANQVREAEKTQLRLEHELLNKTHLLGELEKRDVQGELRRADAEAGRLQVQAVEQEVKRQAAEDAFLKSSGWLADCEKQLTNLEAEDQGLKNQKEKYLAIKDKMVGGTPHPAVNQLGVLQDLLIADRQRYALLENFYYEEMDAPILADPQDALKSEAKKMLIRRENQAQLPEAIKAEAGFRGFVKNVFELKKEEAKAYFKDGVLVDNLANAIRIYLTYGVEVITEKAELISGAGVLIRNRGKGILDVLEEIERIEQKRADIQKASAASALQLSQARNQKKEKAAVLEREEQALTEIKGKALQAEFRASALKKDQALADERRLALQTEMESLSLAQKKAQEMLQMLLAERDGLEKRRQALLSEREQLAVEGENLSRQANDLEKIRLQIESDSQLIQEKVSSRQRSLQEVNEQKAKRLELEREAAEELQRVAAEIAVSEETIRQIQASSSVHEKQKNEWENRIKALENELARVNTRIKEDTVQVAGQRQIRDELRENKKELEIRLAAVKKDLFQLEEISSQELNMELKEIEVPGEVLQRDLPPLEAELNELTVKLNKMRESDRLNFSAEAEFDILQKDHDLMVSQKEDIIKSIQDMNAAVVKIDSESKEGFLKAFACIKENFLANFKILFEGGEAEMTLTDPDNVLDAGLELQAQPPGKRLQGLRLLSGGEKALTSLAFLFALFQYKPSPFCIFDEVDASLDEANIQRFLKFLEQLKTKTQFIIITHNFKTMERADYIYGISMDEPGISKIYSMKMT